MAEALGVEVSPLLPDPGPTTELLPFDGESVSEEDGTPGGAETSVDPGNDETPPAADLA